MAVAVTQHAEFWVSPVTNFAFLPLFSALFATTGIVTADMIGLKTASIYRCQARTTSQDPQLFSALDRRFQQRSKVPAEEQAIGSFLQGSEMRNGGQLNRITQVNAIAKQRYNTSVGKVVKVLEYQTGKQLVLRELSGTKPVGVAR